MRLLTLAAVLALGTSLLAADVDFSGTWELNRDKSELPEMGERGPAARGFAALKMVITQKENKLTVERTIAGRNGEERTMTIVYDLSGKTTKEEGRRGNTEHTAKMAEQVLNIKSVRAFERDGQEFEMITSSTWTLVDDGKGLVIDSVTETPNGERKIKTYYTKK